MKKVLSFFLAAFAFLSNAQNALFIPDTISGTSMGLTLRKDSVQFLPGNITQTYGFNGYKYLGPTILLNKGDQVTINIHNQCGDTTSIHWHGLHIAPANDGGPHTFVLNGAGTSPHFTVMNNASTYWYHTHVDMKTGIQTLRGAAGVIIVRDTTEAALNLPRTYGVDDFPVIVQCHEFDSLNQINPRAMNDSVLLVNGTLNPVLNLPAQVVRLRLLNASQERTFNFGFTGSQSFSVIGSDGGLVSAPISSARIRLSPGERAEILLSLAGMNGQSVYLMSYGSELPSDVRGGPPMAIDSTNTMYSPFDGINFNILRITVGATTANPVTTIPASLVNITRLHEADAQVTRTIHFTADNALVMDGPFYFNDSLFDMMRIDYRIPLNHTEIWALNNLTMVAHPFHIHGVQFQILDRDGNPPNAKEAGWKDVVLVQANETVRFITKFEDFADPNIPYMYHCHILMHEDDGMMGQFLVVDSTASSVFTLTDSGGGSVYPNPASTQFTIETKNGEEIKSLRLYDCIGNKVIDKVGVGNERKTTIAVTAFANGIYSLQWSTPSGTQSRHLVIER